jgi:putative transposase
MSKSYPSHLTREQYELLSDLLPAAKPGGRPRSVDFPETSETFIYLAMIRIMVRRLA